MGPNKVLVTYYSRSGHTRRLAERIAQVLGADLEPIVDQRPRAGLLGYLRSGTRRRPDGWRPSPRSPGTWRATTSSSSAPPFGTPRCRARFEHFLPPPVRASSRRP